MEDMREEMANFWRKVSRLIDTGVPLLQALEVIAEETEDTPFRNVLHDLAEDIRSGKRFSESLERHPACFPPSAVKLIVVGEESGSLEKTTLQLAEGIADGTFHAGRMPKAAENSLPGKKSGLSEVSEDNRTATLVADIIEDGFASRASDIHFERTRAGLRIRYRIDGVLHERPDSISSDMVDAVITRVKIMTNLNVAEKRLPQDGRIAMILKGRDLDLRVSLVPYATGEAITLRLFDKGGKLLGLEGQGLSDDNLDKLKRWIKSPNGTIIVTGPTDCGKTTVLYSMLQALNTLEVKITTVEDPVECLIDGINQQSVMPSIGLTFARALRCQLRQDPDVIMVGAIRDLETAQVVTQTCLTGHLVLTTLHTRDAPESIRRLLDIGIAPFLVNSTLTGIVSQRLVRKICGECKEEYEPEDWIKEATADHTDLRFFRGRGCDKCFNMGFRGRTAIHELLEVDNDMRRLISRDADLSTLREQALSSGMISMRDDGLAKVAQGITSIEELFRVIAGG